jgi:peptidoglycan/LPS O-acetylase OafA/YrhL
LVVLLFHAWLYLFPAWDQIYKQTVWQLASAEQALVRLLFVMFDGHVAVSLFFVLSGFVLALSLQRDNRPPAPQSAAFVSRRFLRIYPAMAVNLVLTAAVLWLFAALLTTERMRIPTAADLGRNLLLWEFLVNGATWTMLIELLAVPLLLAGHFATRWFRLAGLMAVLAATILLLFSPGVVRRLLPGDHIFMYYVRTYLVDYQFMFVLGMVAANLRDLTWFRDDRRAAVIALAAALAAMLCARAIFGYVSRWALLTEAVGCATMMGLLAYGPQLAIHRGLGWRPIKFLGRVSYSFYLYHATALAIVFLSAALLRPTWLDQPTLFAALIMPLLAVAITVPLAWISYVLVEWPTIRLSRRV